VEFATKRSDDIIWRWLTAFKTNNDRFKFGSIKVFDQFVYLFLSPTGEEVETVDKNDYFNGRSDHGNRPRLAGRNTIERRLKYTARGREIH